MDAAFNLLSGMDNVNENRIGVIGHWWDGRVSCLHACHSSNYKALITLYGGRIKGDLPHEFRQYDGAGHGFQDFVNPERYREEQAKDAWAKIRVFLTDNPGQPTFHRTGPDT